MSGASILGQPWFLSVASGLLAVLLYRFTIMQQQQQMKDRASVTKTYTGVFLAVAVLVYGSFMISFSNDGCKMINNNVPIQTGGNPPF
jgi:hypothetical protein